MLKVMREVNGELARSASYVCDAFELRRSGKMAVIGEYKIDEDRWVDGTSANILLRFVPF